jgi:CDP-diglyceride synthetase
MPEGVTSASLIVVILVAAAVGAAVGGMLGPNFDPAVLAVISGFIATIVAVFVRNELINRLSGAGPNDFKIPLVVAIFAIVASLAGSLAGKEFLDDMGGNYSPVWVGTVAGIASAILMSMLMITYYMEVRRA